MQVTIDENNYITNYAVVGELDDGIEIDNLSDEQLTKLQQNFEAYKLVDGELVFDEDKLRVDTEASELVKIRQRRELECFAYINRGNLWYEMLSNDQKIELKNWYSAWLDAPETRVIPSAPVWLKTNQ